MGFKDYIVSSNNKNPPILKSLDLSFHKEDATYTFVALFEKKLQDWLKDILFRIPYDYSLAFL